MNEMCDSHGDYDDSLAGCTLEQPLVKLVSSPTYMGETGAPSLWHSRFMRCVAAVVYLVNAFVLVIPGTGFLGNYVQDSTGNTTHSSSHAHAIEFIPKHISPHGRCAEGFLHRSLCFG